MSDPWTAEELVARNSHELTAHLLVTERRERAEDRLLYEARIRALQVALSDAQRVGLRVMEAHRSGRRVVRVADCVAGL